MGLKALRMVNLAFLLATTGAATPLTSATRAADARVWTLSGVEEKGPDRIYLVYGVPETDDSLAGFSCKPGSGVVKLFVSETNEKLKAGKSVAATLSVGETNAKVAGKLMPNEEAGAPSFEGRLPANDPVFGAMAGGEKLMVAVGSSRWTAPLKGVTEKVRKFAEACAEPR